jgi:two-component system phosphate regulon sensor histidine kinase PhoR
MDNKLNIILCDNYIKEAQYVIESEGLKDIVIISHPADCMNCISNNTKKLNDIILSRKLDKENTRLFSCSICKEKNVEKDKEPCNKSIHSQSILAGETLIKSYIKQGFYILTPGWLMNWEKQVLDVWGLDRSCAKAFFSESASKLMLLDSCLYDNIDSKLDKFGEFVSLKCSSIPIGIDYFKSNLINIYLKWQNCNNKRLAQQKVKQVANFALALQLLTEINQLMDTEELINKMLGIFVMITGASKVAYLSGAYGNKENIFTYRNIAYDSELSKLNFDNDFDNYRVTKSGKGFIIKMDLGGNVFDYIEVDDILLTDRIDEYLNLSITIFKICTFLISNSRNLYEVMESKIKIESESKAVSVFLANMSHELRTPINVIYSGIQLLEKNANSSLNIYSSSNNSHLKGMKQNCLRLLRIVNNLIDITKIESNFMDMHTKNQNIVGIVEDITLSVVEYAKSMNIYMQFDTDIEEKIMALDADKIERIFLNLLANAIKFTASGGYVFVTVYDKENSGVITVRDSGIGIPSNKLNKIFDRFMQVEDSLMEIKAVE